MSSDMLTLNAKSDELAAERDYITSSRIVMGALCTLLLMMGIANYFNVTMTSRLCADESWQYWKAWALPEDSFGKCSFWKESSLPSLLPWAW